MQTKTIGALVVFGSLLAFGAAPSPKPSPADSANLSKLGLFANGISSPQPEPSASPKGGNPMLDSTHSPGGKHQRKRYPVGVSGGGGTGGGAGALNGRLGF